MKKIIFFLTFLIITSCGNKKKKKVNYSKKQKTTSHSTNSTNLKEQAEKGKSYAMGTGKVLIENLVRTIESKGTVKALEFCNENAYSLTDSMSVKFKANVKRVSDKPRNQKNKANQKELEIINKYKRELSENKEIKPVIEEIENKVQFYLPIVTNMMCMQCHGNPTEQINPDVLSKLTELYPKDKAKGYKENQVRGIWSITFNQ